MDIRHIKIQNFKCLNRYSATFCPKANVLIGRNGTGKSTLIHALVKALSFVFSNDKSLGTDFLSAGNNTLNVRGFDTSDFHFDAVTREYADAASIEADGFFYGEILTWTLFKRNFPKASLYPSLYKDAFLAFMSSAKAPNNQWPLLAYYSDSYPHAYSKITKSTLKVINQDSTPRNFGYYQWDEESACTSLWETRLCNCLAKMQPLYTPASSLASAIHEKETVLNEKELEEDAEYKKLVEDQKRLNETFVPLHDEVDYIQQKLSKFIAYLTKVQSDGYDIDFFFATQSEEGYKLTINFKNGKMTITLNNKWSHGKPFSSGEYRTNNTFSYGTFETNMIAAKGDGLVTSFFLYTGNPWDEIDVEILGKDTTKVQFNYYVDGVANNEKIIDLGFDAAYGYHKYAIEYGPGYINWYVDGKWRYGVNNTGFNAPYGKKMPSHPMQIMVNLWPGTGVDSWLNHFWWSGNKYASYDYIKYTPK